MVRERSKGTKRRKTHDSVDVVKAVRVEKVLNVLTEEPFVGSEEVEDVRERVFGLRGRRKQLARSFNGTQGASVPCRSYSSCGHRRTAT
jgi:hypothetical protein